MYVIAPTDPKWFDFLKENHTTGMINFWTPSKWNPQIPANTRWYFKKKGRDKLICGYGTFVKYMNMSIKKAWVAFGQNNGCQTYSSFKQSLLDYFKNALTDNIDNREIGAICLSDVVFFDEKDYINLEATGVDFSNQTVKFKKYHDNDPILSYLQDNKVFPSEFNLVISDSKKKRLSNITAREGQSEFRRIVADAYDNKCCVTGESCPDLLEAAHIQPYKSKESNHIKNGLLLRVDIHKMFDSGLLAIDKDYIIHISEVILSEYYRAFNGKKIALPKNEAQYPSAAALLLKMQELRTTKF